MPYDWDRPKAASNFAKHGVAFEAAERFEWETAVVRSTFNHDTGEPRLLAFGFLDGRLYAMAFSIEICSTRIISLRRANNREIKRYAENDTRPRAHEHP